ncbi:hypothetical protein FRC12_018937 [Ceratobasidium sp. 428]|nr:hypothetical protein FRC12_018937 [Ceratobasidium sp. 428]
MLTFSPVSSPGNVKSRLSWRSSKLLFSGRLLPTSVFQPPPPVPPCATASEYWLPEVVWVPPKRRSYAESPYVTFVLLFCSENFGLILLQRLALPRWHSPLRQTLLPNPGASAPQRGGDWANPRVADSFPESRSGCFEFPRFESWIWVSSDHHGCHASGLSSAITTFTATLVVTAGVAAGKSESGTVTESVAVAKEHVAGCSDEWIYTTSAYCAKPGSPITTSTIITSWAPYHHHLALDDTGYNCLFGNI